MKTKSVTVTLSNFKIVFLIRFYLTEKKLICVSYSGLWFIIWSIVLVWVQSTKKRVLTLDIRKKFIISRLFETCETIRRTTWYWGPWRPWWCCWIWIRSRTRTWIATCTATTSNWFQFSYLFNQIGFFVIELFILRSVSVKFRKKVYQFFLIS